MADNIFDNNASTLRTIAATTGVLTYSNTATDNSFSLDPTDTNDYYKLTVSRSSNVIIKLSPQGGDLKLALLDYTGNPANTIVSGTDNPNSLAEAIVTDPVAPLQPGQTYYIRVSSDNPTTTINYSLSVETLTTSRADLLWRYYGNAAVGGGTNGIWKMNGTQFVEGQVLPYVEPSWQLAAVGDFNRDGNDDYLWRQPTTGTTGLWLMDSTGTNIQGTALLPSGVGVGWEVIGVADFNNDQKLDILWQYTPTGFAGVWLMDGTTLQSGTEIESLQSANWRMETVADVDQDGKPDIVYSNTVTGGTQVWLMDGLKFKASAALPSKSTNIYLRGAGDFNGDGYLDLIARNYITGQADVWFLQGSTFLSSTTITTIDPFWVIADVLKSVPSLDLAGNTPTTAFNIGNKLDATATYNDAIGSGDKDDYYVFTVDVLSKINVTATGLGFAAANDIQIESSNGTVLAFSTPNGADGEKITDLQVNPGTYYVRVKSTSSTSINYSIAIDGAVAKIPTNLAFSGANPVVLRDANGVITPGRILGVDTSYPITVDYNTIYTGNPLNNFKVAFFLSKDGVLDANDYRFDVNGDGQQNANDFVNVTGAPNTVINSSQNLTLPGKDNAFWLNDGGYNILVVLDPANEIEEEEPVGVPKENDNTSAASFQVRFPVNLKFSNTAPVTLKNTNGTTITTGTAVSVKDPYPFVVDYNVTYTGKRLDSFKVAFFLSKDGVRDANDYRFDLNGDGLQNTSDFVTITGEQPNTIINKLQNLTLPSKDSPYWIDEGLYNIIVVLDPENEIAEEEPLGTPKEDDNNSTAGIRVRDARLPDLTPLNFNVVQTQAAKGGQINLEGLVRNIGTAKSDAQNPAGSQFEVRFYLSTDATLSTATDFALGSILDFDPLNAATEVNLTSNLSSDNLLRTLPLNWSGYLSPPQNNTYYVLMVVDPDQTVNELTGGTANNVVFDTIVIS
jgi:hypothetical protein